MDLRQPNKYTFQEWHFDLSVTDVYNTINDICSGPESGLW